MAEVKAPALFAVVFLALAAALALFFAGDLRHAEAQERPTSRVLLATRGRQQTREAFQPTRPGSVVHDR